MSGDGCASSVRWLSGKVPTGTVWYEQQLLSTGPMASGTAVRSSCPLSRPVLTLWIPALPNANARTETPLEISFIYLGKNKIYLISEAAAWSVSHCAQNVVSVTLCTECSLCHNVHRMWSVSHCAQNVVCVTLCTECSLCHNVHRMWSVSHCAQNVVCVTLCTECGLCHIVHRM